MTIDINKWPLVWKIENLERKDNDTGLVIRVDLTVTMSDDDGHIVEHFTRIDLPEKDPTDDDFIAYEDLTEEQVLDWAQTAISERTKSTDIDGVQTNIGIDSIKTVLHNGLLEAHIETTGVPWNS